MKRKLIAIIATVTLVLCAAVPAFAADGDVPNAPVGGNATVTHDGTNFHSEGDEDNKVVANDTDGTQIQVWAKVTNGLDPNDPGVNPNGQPIVYKVDIGWGFMKFQFADAARVWDPATHTYSAGTGGKEWTVPAYLDAVNNKINVTNHSNVGIYATMSYAADGAKFNEAAGTDNVVGNFFKTNDNAKTAALVLTNTCDAGGTAIDAAVSNKLTDSKLELASAEDAGDYTQTGAPKSDDAFFAFSGTPDVVKGNKPDGTLIDFTKVGTITVTVDRVPYTPAP